MSGHSKWANIKRQKAVVDAKKGLLMRAYQGKLLWQRVAVRIRPAILNYARQLTGRVLRDCPMIIFNAP